MSTSAMPAGPPATRVPSRGAWLAALLLAIILGYWLDQMIGIDRGLPPCEIVCTGCDMALYQGHEVMTREPDLFRRDRLFVVHHAIYPQAYSHLMNWLTDRTGNRWTATKILLGALGALFVGGAFLLNRRLLGEPLTAAVAVFLAAFTKRGYPTWGLPNLKPNELVGCASTVLLYFLYRGITERGFILLFTLLAALLSYVHPPTGFVLIGVGALTYAWLARRSPYYREGLLGSALILPVTLAPLLLKHVGGVRKSPALAMLLTRADLTFFPTKGTLTIGIMTMLMPMALAVLVWPVARRRLADGPRRFLVTLTVVAAGLAVGSAATYAWPGLSRFALWFAYRYILVGVFAVLALALVHWRDFGRVRGALVAVAVVALFFNVDSRGVRGLLALRHRHEAPLIATWKASNSADTRCFLADAGAWAMAHTGRDDLFLIPPVDADAGFRVLSHRAVVVADKDGGACAYDGVSGPEWQARMDVVAPAYRDGSRAALLAAATRYDAQYILVPRQAGTPLDGAVFTNDLWVIWPTGIPVPPG